MAKETNFSDPPRGHVAQLGYDSVNDRWQAQAVDGSGLAQVDVADVADRQVNAHGYDGAAWRKLALLWGYSDRLFEVKSDLNAGAGVNTLSFTAVPAGEVHRVLGFSVLNINTAAAAAVYATFGGADCPVGTTVTLTAATVYVYPPTDVVLKAGDFMKAVFAGCIAGDDIYGYVWGYKQSVAL